MNPSPVRSKAIPRAIAACMILATLAAAAWIILDKSARLPGQAAAGISQVAVDSARALATVVKQAITIDPVVRQSTTVLHEGARGTLEVAMAEESFTVEDRFEHTWGGSTKILHTRARFIAKAGYQLDAGNWFVELKPDGSSAVMMPPPAILSCEQTAIEIIADDNGYWNHLSKQDRESAYTRLLAKARAAASGGDLPAMVDKELQRRLAAAAATSPATPTPTVLRLVPVS